MIKKVSEGFVLFDPRISKYWVNKKRHTHVGISWSIEHTDNFENATIFTSYLELSYNDRKYAIEQLQQLKVQITTLIELV